jgi:hypothetical protein
MPLSHPVLGGANKLCLSPDTRLEISPRSITFENRFCKATWKLDDIPIMMDHMKPGSQTADVPVTASGKPQFDRRVSGLNAEVIYFRRRAKSLDMPKYEAWITRLMTDSHTWLRERVTRSWLYPGGYFCAALHLAHLALVAFLIFARPAAEM